MQLVHVNKASANAEHDDRREDEAGKRDVAVIKNEHPRELISICVNRVIEWGI